MDVNLTDMKKLIHGFVGNLEQQKQALVITLSGDLGAGKTTFTQYLAEILGIKEVVTSPTFVIQKEYQVNDHAWINKLVHIDAYRLEDRGELEYLGWNSLIQNSGTLVVMEWPEMVSGIRLPEYVIHMAISINDDQTRKISYVLKTA